ncbi:MAG: ATP-binding protein [Cyanobacteria bacterium SZAS TMP-1]|nr:ATP-binding protein [Cyanobacteria bacterium SZAS TMP-1]
MGPSGSGKTFTALTFAGALGKKIAVIDSERGSASKYADLFSFDTCDMESHSPQTYVKHIKEAEEAGYDVLIIDSLSHAWAGKDGALEQVDKVAKRSQSGNSFTAWREVTPMHNALVDAILQTKCHVIATMRTKQEYVLEENERGKKTPRKVGMAPVQREGVEYEFDVIADMNIDHDFIVAKTRCHSLDGLVARKPGVEVAETLAAWLDAGTTPKTSAAAAGTSSTTTPTSSAATSAQSASSAKSTASKASSTSANASEKSVAQKTSSVDASKADPKSNKESAVPADSNTTAAASTADTSEKPSDAGKALTVVERALARANAEEVVGKEQMAQLLQVGEANGWNRQQISGFICHAFKLTPQTILSSFTWKQWESAVKILGRPENKGGRVTVSGDGKSLPETHQWPAAAQK